MANSSDRLGDTSTCTDMDVRRESTPIGTRTGAAGADFAPNAASTSPRETALLRIREVDQQIEVIADFDGLRQLAVPKKEEKRRDKLDVLTAFGSPIVALAVGVGAWVVQSSITRTTIESTRTTEISKIALQLQQEGMKSGAAIIALAPHGAAAVPVLLQLVQESFDSETSEATADESPTNLKPEETRAAVQRALEFIGEPALMPLAQALDRQVEILAGSVDEPRQHFFMFVAEEFHQIAGGNPDSALEQRWRPQPQRRLNLILEAYLRQVPSPAENQSITADTIGRVIQLLKDNGYDVTLPPLRGLIISGRFEGIHFGDLSDTAFSAGTRFLSCDFSKADLRNATMELATFGAVTETLKDLRTMFESMSSAFKTMSPADRESIKLPPAVKEIIDAIAGEKKPDELLRMIEDYRKGLATS